MAIFDIVETGNAEGPNSPGNAAIAYFYKQGSGQTSGTYFDTEGNVSGKLVGFPDIPAQGYITLDTDSATKAAAGTAINAAIAELPSSGGTIVVPQGTWTVDTAILINKNGVKIQGVGNGVSLLRFDGSTVTSCIAMADTTQRYFQIDNMRIESTSNGAGTAIDASYFVNSVFSNLRIGATGFNPNRGIIFNVIGSYYNHVRDSRISVEGANSRCLSFDNTSNSNMVTNCRLVGDNTNSVGVYVNSHAIEINRVDIETNFLIGIDVAASGHDCTVISPYIEAGETGIQLAANVEAFTCLGGVIIDNAVANITDNGAKDPCFLNTRVQYEPYTSYTARTDAFPQSYPMMTGTDMPQDHGLITWSSHPDGMSNNTVVTGGTIYLTKVQVRSRVTVSNIVWWVTNAGITPTAGQNFVGLYNSSGAQVIAPVNVDSSITAAAVKTTAVTPTVIQPGYYYIAMVFNAATLPGLARGSGQSGNGWSVGLGTAALRYATNGTAATALPASFTLASNTNTGFAGPWAALS